MDQPTSSDVESSPTETKNKRQYTFFSNIAVPENVEVEEPEFVEVPPPCTYSKGEIEAVRQTVKTHLFMLPIGMESIYRTCELPLQKMRSDQIAPRPLRKTFPFISPEHLLIQLLSTSGVWREIYRKGSPNLLIETDMIINRFIRSATLSMPPAPPRKQLAVPKRLRKVRWSLADETVNSMEGYTLSAPAQDDHQSNSTVPEQHTETESTGNDADPQQEEDRLRESDTPESSEQIYDTCVETVETPYYMDDSRLELTENLPVPEVHQLEQEGDQSEEDQPLPGMDQSEQEPNQPEPEYNQLSDHNQDPVDAESQDEENSEALCESEDWSEDSCCGNEAEASSPVPVELEQVEEEQLSATDETATELEDETDRREFDHTISTETVGEELQLSGEHEEVDSRTNGYATSSVADAGVTTLQDLDDKENIASCDESLPFDDSNVSLENEEEDRISNLEENQENQSPLKVESSKQMTTEQNVPSSNLTPPVSPSDDVYEPEMTPKNEERCYLS